jgi:hypothetical protein
MLPRVRTVGMVLCVAVLSGCGSSSTDPALVKRVASLEAQVAQERSALRSGLDVMERRSGAEAGRLQRLQGCIPELVAYIDAIEASLGGGGGDPTKQITAACLPLLFPEGLPLN